jgi:hypothetical protein
MGQHSGICIALRKIKSEKLDDKYKLYVVLTATLCIERQIKLIYSLYVLGFML